MICAVVFLFSLTKKCLEYLTLMLKVSDAAFMMGKVVVFVL